MTDQIPHHLSRPSHSQSMSSPLTANRSKEPGSLDLRSIHNVRVFGYSLRSMSQVWQIAIISTIIRLIVVIYMTFMPDILGIRSFDSSAQLMQPNLPIKLESFLRWDPLYFARIAMDGYKHEQEMAFMPLWPAFMRFSGQLIAFCTGQDLEIKHVVIGGTTLANICTIASSIILYRVTEDLSHDKKFAYHTALLYTLSPAPAIMSSPFTEPFFAFLTFTGYWMTLASTSTSSRGKDALKKVVGTLCLAGASGTRSLGILGCIPIVWQDVVVPFLRGMRSFKSIFTRLVIVGIQCLFIVSPFAIFQAVAYVDSCLPLDQSKRPEWCENIPPLIYSYVQKHYWNVGFLRYWTLAQIPNFLLASPVILISIHGIYLSFSSQLLSKKIKSNATDDKDLFKSKSRFLQNARLTPFAIVHLITTCILIFASHTQIILRVSSGNPFVWWTIAAVAFEEDHETPPSESTGQASKGVPPTSRFRLTMLGRYWIRWVIVWGGVSIILLSGFYPPA